MPWPIQEGAVARSLCFSVSRFVAAQSYTSLIAKCMTAIATAFSRLQAPTNGTCIASLYSLLGYDLFEFPGADPGSGGTTQAGRPGPRRTHLSPDSADRPVEHRRAAAVGSPARAT